MDDYKLAIINDKDNGIEKIGSRKNDDLHIICLLNYIKEKYRDNKLLNQLNERHTPDAVGYYLTLFDNNILFFNTTTDVSKYGKTGFFMFPKEISDNQKIKLYEFADEINDYFIDIAYDFTVDDGFLNASELKSAGVGDISNLLDTYFEKKHNKNR